MTENTDPLRHSGGRPEPVMDKPDVGCAEDSLSATGTRVMHSAAYRHRRSLQLAFALTSSYFVIEVIGAALTNSLALLADAAHMLTDVGGLALALFAVWISQRPPTSSKTYGYYRVEILAALTNAVVLFAIGAFVLYEAYRRFQDPPRVASLPMLAIASVGLAVNLSGIALLRRGSKDSLNLQGAFLEVLSDALGSVAVIASGLIMLLTGWYYADPIFGAFIGIFIVPRTWKLLARTLNVLMESTPPHIDVQAVEKAIREDRAVADVHDLHIWAITSGIEILTAHVILKDATMPQAPGILERLYERLWRQFGIDHATIQVDSPESCRMAEHL